jgi:hypothetical protein
MRKWNRFGEKEAFVLLVRKYALDMLLPEGKLPGFYAQIVKGIAEQAPLFDRHKELLVFDSEEQRVAATAFLAHYKVDSERSELLLLPAEGIVPGDLYGDYAIETRSERVFVDARHAAPFRITAARPDAEREPALLQLDEHRIVTVGKGDDAIYFIDRQLTELAEGIARAYGCSAEWLNV